MLTVRIIRSTQLTAGETGAMLELLRVYFDQVAEDVFRRDLAQKNWVILLQHPEDGIVGFSTQQLISQPHAPAPDTPSPNSGGGRSDLFSTRQASTSKVPGKTARFLFSGDTIVHHRHRNQTGLAGAFGHLMLKLIAHFPDDELYWFLISKGPRTYRFLPLFFNDFHPDPLRFEPMRDRLKAHLDAIAAGKFGGDYTPASGIVRFAVPRDRLKPEGQALPRAPGHDPYIRFFIAANPGWRCGDELACIAPIRLDNLNAYARRVIRATEPKWEC